jgi:hypothetical protein
MQDLINELVDEYEEGTKFNLATSGVIDDEGLVLDCKISLSVTALEETQTGDSSVQTSSGEYKSNVPTPVADQVLKDQEAAKEAREKGSPADKGSKEAEKETKLYESKETPHIKNKELEEAKSGKTTSQRSGAPE